MRVGKIVGISLVSLASLIVVGAVIIAITVFAPSRGGSQQNFAPTEGQQALSPGGNFAIFSRSSGSSSFLYRKDLPTGASVRLTAALSGIESEASFSHDGKLVVYSFADSPSSKSAVWVVSSDGKNAHSISSKDEDALHPVFSPDDTKVFYAVSNFTGNHSPVVRPARHDWDVFSVPIYSGSTGSAVSTRITRSLFYDMQSLDASADGLNPGGTKILISTTGYPIGALLEEFNLGVEGRDKIFQPHVPGEPSVGPAYGGARFMNDGMEILFLAATNTSGGNYDYNVFSMNDVTGSDIKQLTRLQGMTTELKVLPGRKASFVNGGIPYVLDISAQVVKPLEDR